MALAAGGMARSGGSATLDSQIQQWCGLRLTEDNGSTVHDRAEEAVLLTVGGRATRSEMEDSGGSVVRLAAHEPTINVAFAKAAAAEEVIGKLNVRVVRGSNLAICDPLTHTSDPYVVLCYGSQKVKSSVQKKNPNPVWNEVLQLSVTDPTKPVKLEVFDEDKFTADDSMGVAEFNVIDIYDAAKLDLKHASDGTRIKTIYPVGVNYLGGESHVSWKNGKVVQDLILKLKNVDSGLIVLQLEWVHVPGVKL